MGIDVSQPRFSWVVAHLQRNQYQSAYQVRFQIPTFDPFDIELSIHYVRFVSRPIRQSHKVMCGTAGRFRAPRPRTFSCLPRWHSKVILPISGWYKITFPLIFSLLLCLSFFVFLPSATSGSSDQHWFWKVYWWDANGNISPPSQVAQFYTAFLSSSDWSPSVWIGGANMLRTVFSTSSSASISRAMVYVCGLG